MYITDDYLVRAGTQSVYGVGFVARFRTRDFPRPVHTRSEAHPASYTEDTGSSFLDGKAVGT